MQRIQPAFIPITRATPAIRWYSDAAPAEAKKEAGPTESNEASKDDAAQLKTQLEKKDKEIIDLKVCLMRHLFPSIYFAS